MIRGKQQSTGLNQNYKNKMKRIEVFELINGEREYQDSIWNSETTASGGKHSPEEWIMYIEDYLLEAKHILSRENVQSSYPKAMAILRKVASMAVCAMEQIDTPKREINNQ
jgi:hypothetical protein